MIAEQLARVDTARVLAVSSALTMRLENVNELLILERLTKFAATHATAPGAEPSSSALRRLLAQPELGGQDVLAQLDPFEDLPVRELNFPPGRYLVSAGLATSSVEVVTRMTRAVFTQPRARFPATFVNRVGAATTLLAGLNDQLCRTFDRAPGETVPPLRRQVHLPSAKRFNADAAKVVFTDRDLFSGFHPHIADWLRDTLIRHHGTGPSGPPGPHSATSTKVTPTAHMPARAPGPAPSASLTGEALFRRDGEAVAEHAPGWPVGWPAEGSAQGPGERWWETGAPDGDGVIDSTTITTPLVATHLGLVVASPTLLMAALRHLIISEAVESDCVAELARSMSMTGLDDVIFWLDHELQADPVPVGLDLQPDQTFQLAVTIATTATAATDGLGHASRDASRKERDPDETASSSGSTQNDDADVHAVVEDALWDLCTKHTSTHTPIRLLAPFDGDKTLDLRLHADPLTGYDTTDAWGKVPNEACTDDDTKWALCPPKTLVLELHLNSGRVYGMRPVIADGPVIACDLDDLAVLLSAPDGSLLTLWYFATALHNFTQHSELNSYSVLDTYEIFRTHRESFYISDDFDSCFLGVEVGTGQSLREASPHRTRASFELSGPGIARVGKPHGEATAVVAVFSEELPCQIRLDIDRTAWAYAHITNTQDAHDPAGRTAEEPATHLALPREIKYEVQNTIAYWTGEIFSAHPELFTPDTDTGAGIGAGTGIDADTGGHTEVRIDAYIHPSGVTPSTPHGSASTAHDLPVNGHESPGTSEHGGWVQLRPLLTAHPSPVARRKAHGFSIDIYLDLVHAHLAQHPPPGHGHVIDPTETRAAEQGGDQTGSRPVAPPNALDRALVVALVEGLARLTGHGDMDLHDIAAEVAPPGHKQMLHLVGPDADPLRWPTDGRHRPQLRPAACAIVLDGIAGHLAEAGFAPGTRIGGPSGAPDTSGAPNTTTIGEARAKASFLNTHVTGFLLDWLQTEMSELNVATSLEHLVGAYEALLHGVVEESDHRPSRRHTHTEPTDHTQSNHPHRTRHETTVTSIGLRFLIELLTATQTTPRQPVQPTEPVQPGQPGQPDQPGQRHVGVHLTQERLDLLIALAAEVVDKGQTSDALADGLATYPIAILNSGRLGIDRVNDPFAHALDAYIDAQDPNGEHLPLAHPIGGWSHVAATPDIENLDTLTRIEFGFSYTELAAACVQLVQTSQELDQHDVGVLTRAQALHAISVGLTATDKDTRNKTSDKTSKAPGEPVAAGGPTPTEETVRTRSATDPARVLDALSLAARDSMWDSPTDVYPWRFGRAQSYLRRPLLTLTAPRRTATADQHNSTQLNTVLHCDGVEVEVEELVMFGWRNLYLTTQHWLDRHLSGRIQATSPEMSAATNREANIRGHAFEDYVGARAVEAGCPQARTRVRRIAGTDLRKVGGVNLGDIDVLVVTPGGDIVVIEAKALAFGRTPRELKSEMDKLTNSSKAATTRARERAKHLRHHHRGVEADLGLAHDPRRTIRPLVVTDLPLIGSHLNTTDVPIVAVDDIAASL